MGFPPEAVGSMAVVELNPGDELSEDAVQQAVADRIASFK